MKKLIVRSLSFAKLCVIAGVISVTTAGVANAYDAAKLQIEMSGVDKSKFYLCISDVGCVRIDSNHQTLPINPTDVRYIFLAKTATNQMYPQRLPTSCAVAVNGNQKLVVKGKLAKAANDNVYIADLHCAVS